MRLFLNPIKDIEDACKNNSFFTAFTLASTYFEYEANLILSARFENRIPFEILGRWNLQTKIELLFGMDIIDLITHDKISQIVKIRNKLIHPTNIWKKGRMQDIFLPYRLTEKEKSSLLSFKECYFKLGEAHYRTLAK